MTTIKETRIGVLGHVDSGKCFLKGTPIKMMDGTCKNIENINIHDRVKGDDNKERIVTEKTNGYGKMYLVEQEDKMNYVVNSYHILSLYFDTSTLKKEEKTYFKGIIKNYNFSIIYTNYLDITITDYLNATKFNNLNQYLLGYNIDGTKHKIKVSEYENKEDYYYGISLDPFSRNLRFQLEDGTIVHNSTLTGIFTKRNKQGNLILDDGRGKLRSLIMKHPHEKESGRTSDIAQHVTRDIQEKEEKVNVFIDLAGHEKYFRVTLNGITKSSIHWCCLVIAANMGVLRMTREHLSIALLFNIPIFIVITKLDLSPDNITKQTFQEIQKLFRQYAKSRPRKLVMIQNQEQYQKFMNTQWKNKEEHRELVPIFPISQVTGQNIESMLNFIKEIYPMKRIDQPLSLEEDKETTQFIIDCNYHIQGIGFVVSGVVTKGTIKKNDILALGPFYNNFIMVCVKSIHNNFREFIPELEEGLSGCLNIKPVVHKHPLKRSMLRRGIKLLSHPRLNWRFKAVVKIVHHHTTIKVGYSPYLHCGNISQSCVLEEIITKDKDVLRIGDEAIVIFKFCFKPEFIIVGEKLVFREGKTKGVGKIIELLDKT